MSDTFDLHLFIKKLASTQIALFEPLSGLMLLNVTEEYFQEVSRRFAGNQAELDQDDIAYLSAVNHESYHYVQMLASGYMVDRQYSLEAALKRSSLLRDFRSWISALPTNAIVWILRKTAGKDSRFKQRVENIATVLEGYRIIHELNSNALNSKAEENHSVWVGMKPEFYEYQNDLNRLEAAQNSDGLSILGLIEGAAIVHTVLFMNGRAEVEHRIRQNLSEMPALYSELYDLTVKAAGDQAIDLILPAAALALCYKKPHNAYKHFVSLLYQGDNTLHVGSVIAKNLPSISGAGKCLGFSTDVRHHRVPLTAYASTFAELDASGATFDPYNLLADATAMDRISTICPMITRTGIHAKLEGSELAIRMSMMSIVLSSWSRHWLEHNHEKFVGNWGRESFMHFYGPPPPEPLD